MKNHGFLRSGMMMSMSALVVVSAVLVARHAHALPAFSGAEGFGANSIGGRGGRVIQVSNLSDSGPGSFREAVTSTGARIVVFSVSGIVNLQTDIMIDKPFVTIAGQTSPGGILIAGRSVSINTHDVIVQHIRFRTGTHRVTGPSDAETLGAMGIYGNYVPSWFPNDAYNIIVDHCSFSWAVDEILDVATGARDITLSWNIFSEPLDCSLHPKGCHGKGVLVSAKYCNPCSNVSFHHNFLAHIPDRNPMFGGGVSGIVTGDIVNNVIYNFNGSLPMSTQGNANVNYVHNFVKPGPKSNAWSYEAVALGASSPTIYMEGNIGARRVSQSADEWSIGYMWYNQLLAQSYRTLTRWPAPSVTTTVMSSAAAAAILASVGASVPVRDSVDGRAVQDFFAGTGAFRDAVTYPSDFPVFLSPAPPQDVDDDGMADAWEAANGLNVGVDDSAQDADSDGYTNIEEYLHSLSTGGGPPDSTPPAAPRGLRVR